MVIWILNFGEGLLGVNYLIFTTLASLGVLQFVAGRGRLVGLILFSSRLSKWLGVALVAGAYVWFFAFQPDLLIPGLAGGELFTLFLVGFVLALLISVALGIMANRLFRRATLRLPNLRESVTLTGGAKAKLWLPQYATPPLVVALREASTDSLDVLGGELVNAGAAVLLCPEAFADAALQFVERNAGQFHPTRRFAMGVGRGADRVLQLASANDTFSAVLALAPFGSEENARPGLRWLRETDYLTALAATFRYRKIPRSDASPSACIVYGDEDTLISPATARHIYPSALLVAGARHFTLARMAATKRLAADLFDLRTAPVSAPGRVTAPAAPLRGGLGE
jgi:hypothetical protein